MNDLNVEQLTILYRLVSWELDNHQPGCLPNCLTNYHNQLSFLLTEIHDCIRKKMNEFEPRCTFDLSHSAECENPFRDSKYDECNSAMRDCSLCGSGDDA